MKKIVTFVFGLAVSLFASNALAEESYSAAFFPKNATEAACMQQCQPGTSPATANCCGEVANLKQELDDLKKRLFQKKPGIKPGIDKIKALQDALKALEARVGANEADIAKLKAALDNEVAVLNARVADVNALTILVNEHEAKIKALQEKDKEHDAKLNNHEARLQRLERNPEFGIRAGVLLVHAFGTGHDYSAVPVTAYGSFPVGEKLSLVVEAGVTVAASQSPVGTTARAALTYPISDNKRWTLEGGPSAIWAGYDRKLDAQLAVFSADLGAGYRNGAFTARVAVLPGTAIEPGVQNFSLGGLAQMGVRF